MATEATRLHLPELDQVTIVVVTYNSAHCIPVLQKFLQYCPHIIFSDNGSNDDTVEQVRRLLPHAHALTHGKNLGFGTANNRALTQVSTPFAMLLNPDCEMEAQAIADLVQAAQAMPEAALIAPQLTGASGKPEINYRWQSHLWKSQGPGADAPACVGFVTGAVMLFRMELAQQIAFFDEDFFLYYEDDDLCLRLFQARLPIVICPQIQAMHRSRGSVRGNRPLHSEYLRGYHHAQSKLLFAHKHVTPAKAQDMRRKLIAGTSAALPLRLLAFSPRLLARMWGRLRGVIEWKP
ncbi:glycosyltransferase family 2 protein [Brachymonas sp. J145]|uniref:glycosyltransferase family 2 protein n=1 Tax=Brachymonas sp. J145 TaxID=3116489 RepID=UPI002E78DF36|nr:glycosyltransferase family 2 protein [Brachymonas sp. J145]MEE1652436.1 glycosyltransferase family 2 protein [Brachymonas sp. J145]